jgi:hypothetical protein
MLNKRMEEMLREGEAIDVSPYLNRDGDYDLPASIDVDGKDLCNAETEQWIWSVGKRLSDGAIIASHSSKLYQNPEFECIWLR